MGNLQPLEKNLFIRKNGSKQTFKLSFINLRRLLLNLTTIFLLNLLLNKRSFTASLEADKAEFAWSK